MAPSLKSQRKVFCIEGEWSRNLAHSATVGHALALLKDLRVVKDFSHK